MEQQRGNAVALKVAEALTKDVGRAIARLDPQDMASMGVGVGDIVRIAGKRPTVAKAMPAYPEDRGKSIAQIDGITRENAQTGLGEKVQIQKMGYDTASSVVLAPIAASGAFASEKDRKYLARLLEGLAMTQGDKIRATFLGSRYSEFSVLDTTPKGAVVIGSLSAIKVKGEASTGKEKTGVAYEDIGGLQKEIQRIREMIELPLKYPEIFERLGIGAPKGVLLYGPPGCGKTLIARAVANETDAYFVHISGPEIIHKFYGESEAHLRAIFEKAGENAPAIVFLDEIDAIASKREDIRGDQQVERRVVAQLLALMDGLKSRGQVIVIGATNIPNVLDPALRRPGRFDREIAISIPDKNGRLVILGIHTRGMPLASEVNLERIAEITHGFVGADLEALCREAAMVTLRKIMPKIEFEADRIPYELLLELEVTMGDFLEALKDVEPSAIREVFTEVPDVKWDDVGGLEEAKRVLVEAIEWPLKYASVFERAHIKAAKGILLTGPPGAGKTLLAKAVASQSGVNFISVKGPALLSKWVGESERGIREVFSKARQASPCIIFFDEIDAIVPVRGGGTDSHVTQRVVSQFLTELDGIEELRGVVVLAATNRPDIIDPALLRAGRFDFQLELPIPDEKARLEIFKIHTKDKPLAGDVDLESLARATKGLVGSDIEAICRTASLTAIREFVNGLDSGNQPSEARPLSITAKHFEEALKNLTKGAQMRKLICIPIVHAESDLGSLGAAISRRSASLVGERRWAEHNETVAKFWKSIEDYVQSLDEPNLKVYQDGLAADGELGGRVIEAAASKGSKNHQIVLELISKGAEIRNTEDVSLLLEERENLIKLMRSAVPGGATANSASLREEQRRLLAKRDRHIADRINGTLRDGETAILFLGAQHNVVPRLAKDIVVEWAKQRETVNEYFRNLVSGQDANRYRELSAYMASSIAGAN